MCGRAVLLWPPMMQATPLLLHAAALLLHAAALLPPASGAAPLRQASFRLSLDDLAAPGWPERFRNYTLFVCTPRFVEADLRKIREDIPGGHRLGGRVNIQTPLRTFWNDGVNHD